MGTLSPKAVVKLWAECLDYARQHKIGIYGAKNSPGFAAMLDANFDRVFGKHRTDQQTEIVVDGPHGAKPIIGT